MHYVEDPDNFGNRIVIRDAIWLNLYDLVTATNAL